MEPKLLKTEIASYIPAFFDPKAKHGISPLGDKVLIRPDKAAEIVGKIHIPQDVTYRHSLAAESGVVMAVGEGAFKWNSDKTTPFEGRVPKPGDRVIIEKYSGQVTRGDDKEIYRLMESACVAAIITEDK